MGPLQLATPFADHRTAVTSTEYVPAERLPDPGELSVKVLLQPTPFESQNCGKALTVSTVPDGIVPLTSCLLMLMVWSAAFASVDVVNVWPPTKTVDPAGIDPANAFTRIDVCRVPVRLALSVVRFGWPADAMFGSSGGRRRLLTNPPF